MSEIMEWTGPNGQVFQSVTIDGKPYFVAGEVAKPLGYAKAADATRLLPRSEKAKHRMRTPGGMQSVTVINEQGLQRLFLRSNSPEAVAFQDWLLYEVLPAIKRDGTYMTVSKAESVVANSQTPEGYLREAAEFLARAQSIIAAQGEQIKEMEPIVQIYDSAWKGESACLTEFFQFALSTRVDTRTCRRLKDQLIEAGVLMDRHGQEEPSDEYLPYFKLKPFVNPRGADSLTIHVRSAKRHELAAKIRPFLSI